MLNYIDEIERALFNRCYLSALALALTIPDIGCRIVMRGSDIKFSYSNWYDKYVVLNEVPYFSEDKEYSQVIFDGLICYMLRYSFFMRGI